MKRVWLFREPGSFFAVKVFGFFIYTLRKNPVSFPKSHPFCVDMNKREKEDIYYH